MDEQSEVRRRIKFVEEIDADSTDRSTIGSSSGGSLGRKVFLSSTPLPNIVEESNAPRKFKDLLGGAGLLGRSLAMDVLRDNPFAAPTGDGRISLGRRKGHSSICIASGETSGVTVLQFSPSQIDSELAVA